MAASEDISYLMKATENVKNHTKIVTVMVRQIKQNVKGSKKVLERNSPMKRKLTKLKTMKKKIKPLQSEPKQLFNKNIKHPYSNRVGEDQKSCDSSIELKLLR